MTLLVQVVEQCRHGALLKLHFIAVIGMAKPITSSTPGLVLRATRAFLYTAFGSIVCSLLKYSIAKATIAAAKACSSIGTHPACRNLYVLLAHKDILHPSRELADDEMSYQKAKFSHCF